MRKNNVEQMTGEGWVLQLQFELNTRRQKGRAFEKTFDIGVEDLEPVHPEPRGDLWIALGELGPHLAEKGQFRFIMLQQSGIQDGLAPVLKRDMARRRIELTAQVKLGRNRFGPHVGHDIEGDQGFPTDVF